MRLLIGNISHESRMVFKYEIVKVLAVIYIVKNEEGNLDFFLPFG